MNLIIFSKGVTFEIQDVNFVRRLNFITTNNNFLLWNQTQGRGGGVFPLLMLTLGRNAFVIDSFVFVEFLISASFLSSHVPSVIILHDN